MLTSDFVRVNDFVWTGMDVLCVGEREVVCVRVTELEWVFELVSVRIKRLFRSTRAVKWCSFCLSHIHS